ncbi:MAG: hypothetical protein BAA01_04210 [Bacillus thermozeamaize]|uniref:HTH gntR-type domain-containing protein n=1 Tax=Bacillus thermozeamaize TaxID=230954 RepID=A0A1Y3P9Z7_9BACI|nr:MAG: hypothetical protein BAA01_04210 [Bacillus thermozeamaize]
MRQKFRTKAEKVYHHLREGIIHGTYAPGQRLVISQIARQLDVSEIPVREALQRLASEGYVYLHPHAGGIVSSLSEEDIRQIFELRIHLEGLATRLAVDHLSNAHLHRLEEMLLESRQYIENRDYEGYDRFNRAFHEYIYQFANNQRLADLIRDLWNNSSRYPRIFQDVHQLENSYAEHQDILRAIKLRDAELAERLTRQHKAKAYEWAVKLVKDLNQEFTNSK